MPPYAANLCKVDIYASCVLEASLAEAWLHTRNFGHATWWLNAGRGEFAVKRLGARAPAEIGCERIFSIGSARLFEELTGLDDMEHLVRWVLVSHPSTISPFGQASFLNYTSSIQLKEVTMSNQTFGEWRGQFWTEPQYAAQMEGVLQSWYFEGFKALEAVASGLGSLDIPLAVQPPYVPNALNPKYSMPVQPPPSEQLAFTSPLELRENEGRRLSQGSQEPFINGLATPQSYARQQARSAFGGSQAGSQAGTNTRNAARSAVSPPSQLRSTPQIPHGPSSNASSAESMRQGVSRRTTETEATTPVDGLAIGQPVSNSGPMSMYRPHLGAIKEGSQLACPPPELPMQVSGGRDPYDNAALGFSSKGSSLNSNHSQGSNRGILRQQISQRDPTPPIEAALQHKGQAKPPVQQMSQKDIQRPRMSDRNEEAMQKLKLGSGPRPNDRRQNMRKKIMPDWASMKESAMVDSQYDAEVMQGVARNLGQHNKANTQRTSLEEEVARLQERQTKLHAERKSTETPYVSPFCANPFAAMQQPIPED